MFLTGTPFAIAGAERATPEGPATRAWAAYPVSATGWMPAGAVKPVRRSERFLIEGGQESVQLVLQAPGGLYYRAPQGPRTLRPRPRSLFLEDSTALPAAPDTTYTAAEMLERLSVVRRARQADSLWLADSVKAAIPRALTLGWAGLQAGTDAEAWMALWNGTAPTFRLFSGAYVASGGASASAAAYPRGVLVTDSTWRGALLARLTALDSFPPQPMADVTSTFAQQLNRSLVARIDTARLKRPVDREAYTYARNWTGSYEPTSVAATLYEAWIDAEARLNRLAPEALAADTAFFASVRRTAAFVAAVDGLHRRFGPDLRTWRWGEAVPHRRTFAGFSVPGLSLPAQRRYAPVTINAGGHPATLGYGPIRPSDPTATYALDVPLAGPDVPRLARFDYDPNRFLARYRISSDPVVVQVRPEVPRGITRLLPR